MVRFLGNVLLKPLLAILFFLVFGGAFTFAGHQVIRLEAARDASGAVSFDFTHEHLWGLLKFPHRVENVRRAEMETHRTRRKGHTRTMTRVMLVGERDSASLSGMSSNLDERIKREMLEEVNTFLADPHSPSWTRTYTFNNIFLWVGLPFFLVGVAGLFGWPFTILRALRRPRPTEPPIPTP